MMEGKKEVVFDHGDDGLQNPEQEVVVLKEEVYEEGGHWPIEEVKDVKINLL